MQKDVKEWRRFSFRVIEPLDATINWIRSVRAIYTRDFIEYNGSEQVYLEVGPEELISLTSEMVQIGERQEIGRFVFEKSTREHVNFSRLELVCRFRSITYCEKVIFCEKLFCVETGVRFFASGNINLTLIASSFPRFITFFGETIYSGRSAAEYDLDEYDYEKV